MDRLVGNVAIITGAASGQGAVEAKLFAKEGAKVIATDMQFEMLETFVQEINAEFPEAAIAMKHNIVEEQEWIQVVENAVKQHGKVDILVNNAGITGTPGLALEDYSVEEW